MRQQTFDEFWDNEGSDLYDEVLSWAEDAPDGINISDMVGDLEDYANEVVRDIYESRADDYAEYLYDQMRDDRMMDYGC